MTILISADNNNIPEPSERLYGSIIGTFVVALLLLNIGLFAANGSLEYVDGIGKNYTNNATGLFSNTSGWTDCFVASEPHDRFGFTSLWFQQEWDKTVVEKLGLIALV